MYKDKNGQETEISTIVKRRADLDGEDSLRRNARDADKTGQTSGARTARSGMTGKTPIPEDPEILDQSDSVNQRFAPKSANKVMKKQQDELNDYLAYQGVKSLKAMELERLKEKEELAKCTFRPQVINYKNTPAKGNLEKREVDKAIYEQVKSDIELKACTFKPSLTKKSKKIIAKYSKEPAKSYEILHLKHQ